MALADTWPYPSLASKVNNKIKRAAVDAIRSIAKE
ncbi:MAG: hypothetical protein ACI8R8_002510 [Paraglaciecola sp.]|jgi:hypothetical protein